MDLPHISQQANVLPVLKAPTAVKQLLLLSQAHAMRDITAQLEPKILGFFEYFCYLLRPEDYYCVAGQKCPEGSATAASCVAGTYQNDIKKGACMPCPRG
jgi:hypothetical protein